MIVGAVDVGKTKLDFAKSLGADFVVDGSDKDCVKQVVDITKGGSHGVLVLATSDSIFGSAIGMTRRRGTVVTVGLPPGSFPTAIFDVVLGRITIRGSIVGTRKDMTECLDIAARGLVKASVATDSLDNINDVFDKLKGNKYEGRIVLDMCNHGHPNCTTAHHATSNTTRGRRH